MQISNPKTYYTSSQVRAMDQYAIQQMGVPGFELMQRAARACFDAITHRWSLLDYPNVVVFCGAGNNAGDGYLLAELLRSANYDVHVVTVSDPSLLTGDAAIARDVWFENGVTIAWEEHGFELADDTIVVDALFGIGLDRPPEGVWLEAIQAINAAPGVKLAVDIPSGIDGTTGRVLGDEAVCADATVTFIGRKLGLYIGAGEDYAGEVVFASLDVEESCTDPVVLDTSSVDVFVNHRSAAAHKGVFGTVLCIGGNYGMAGAVLMTGEAALRAGAGRVTIATRPEHQAAIIARRPELMTIAVDEPVNRPSIEQRLDDYTAIAIGPGLGTDDWANALWRMALESGLPLIVDADALNLLAADQVRRENWVLTPHPGEAARLLNTTTSKIQRDRLAAVTELQRRYGGTVVLKGNGTLIATEGEQVFLCTKGNPGMATAGMGDVLTGLIAGLHYLDPQVAAVYGVEWHAAAADHAVQVWNQPTLLATDLFDSLPSHAGHND